MIQTAGTLGLNWRLMMASLDVIDYVVVHELAHLRVANHTHEFWTIVEEQIPNDAEYIEWLEENSTDSD